LSILKDSECCQHCKYVKNKYLYYDDLEKKMIYNFTCEKHDRVKIKAVEHVFDYVCDDFKDRYYIESEE